MLSSGILRVLTTNALVAGCGVGQEVTVFGLTLVNTTNFVRVVTLSLYRQIIGSAQTLDIELGPKETMPWTKPIALQPGDHLDISADAVGVSSLWSMDLDTGANPVATGFVIRGNYSNIASYSACDITFDAGATYVAIQNSTGHLPSTSPAYWMMMLDGSGVTTAVATVVGGAPGALDTLNKLAASIGNDPSFANTVATALALKASTAALAAVAFTGDYNDLVGVKKRAVRRLFSSRELI